MESKHSLGGMYGGRDKGPIRIINQVETRPQRKCRWQRTREKDARRGGEGGGGEGRKKDTTRGGVRTESVRSRSYITAGIYEVPP